MLTQFRSSDCVIASFLASAESGDQYLHVEYNKLSFLYWLSF